MIDDKAVMEQASDAYEMIDRFLRNNLYDDDYAEYSAALDLVLSTPVAQPEQPAETKGTIVVTKNEAGAIVAVTRQDTEGRILEIIAEVAQTEHSEPVVWLWQHISNASGKEISQGASRTLVHPTKACTWTPPGYSYSTVVTPLYAHPTREQPAADSALSNLLFQLDQLAGNEMIPWQIEDAFADYQAAINPTGGTTP